MRIVLDAVEPECHSLDQHLLQSALTRGPPTRDLVQATFQTLDDRIDVRKGNLFLARKVQIDTSFPYTDLGRQIVDRHLLITRTGEETVSRVEDRIASGLRLY